MAMIAKAPIAWARITGEPHPGYNKTQKEWDFDVGVTEEVLETLKKEGVSIGQYVKPKTNPKSGKDHALGMDYLKFTRKEIKADGSPSKPFKVVDRYGKPWDPNVKIGNGSLANIKFAVNETQNGHFKPAALAIQIWELVEYGGDDAFPIAEGDENWDKD